MKPLNLLLAVLFAVLAGPALAQVNHGPDSIPAGDGPQKFDFTARPKLRPHLVRPARDASKPMTVEEARALRDDLFSTYYNLSGLSLFRFHQRTKDEAPMTPDEIGWAETELKDEMAHAEKLAPEAETALKTGIERPAPLPKDFKGSLGRKLRASMRVRGVYSRDYKPTYEDYRRIEHSGMSGVMNGLYTLVDEASSREEDSEEGAKHVVQARKYLDEDYASVENARKGMQRVAKEAEARPKEESATAGAASQRAQRAINAGPKGGSTAKGAGAVLEDRAKTAAKDDAAGIPDSGKRITPEEAAREANAAELRAVNRKRGRSPAIVPAP